MLYVLAIAVVLGIGVFIGIQFARKNPKKADGIAGLANEATQKIADQVKGK